MGYYHLPTDTERSPGRVERKLSDGAWLSPPDGRWTPELAALCGFAPVVGTARPADTDTATYERTVELVAGVPTVVWVERPWTQAELDGEAAESNAATIRAQAEAALSANQTFLAIVSPTNAQTLAQVKALTRQVNKLIRLSLGKFDSAD